jgi:hypothetical protein
MRFTETLRFATPLLPLAALLAVVAPVACGSSDDEAAGASGAGPDVVFHADVAGLPGVQADTGLVPSGSPVQLELSISASGSGAVDARAVASGSKSAPTLTAKKGSGKVAIAGGFAFDGRLVVDITGLPKYDGPIPGLADVKLEFSGDGTFDPYLLGGEAKAVAPIPATDLPAIPLPGGLPGKLVLKVSEGSEVDVAFHGTCASIEGATAQYTGSVTRGGSLVLAPRVEIDVPVVGTKTFDIPSVTVPIAVPAEDVDLGSPTVTFGAAAPFGDKAKVGSCHGGGQGGAGHGGAGQGGTAHGGAGQGGAGQGGAGGAACLGAKCVGDGDCCDGTACVSGACAHELTPCQACTAGACADELDACQPGSECDALWACAGACEGADFACEKACLEAHPQGQEPFFRVQGCGFAKCRDACDAAGCLFSTGEASCDACVSSTCSAECDAAMDSQDCMTFQLCSAFCQDISCAVDCGTWSSAGCKVVYDCLVASCTSQCSGG